ncbi:MAG: beta-lactamase family protein, partial [Leptospiraceae bacterium]|nr:beta-lactamase family protein [Leptospiraceae bacterium]
MSKTRHATNSKIKPEHVSPANNRFFRVALIGMLILLPAFLSAEPLRPVPLAEIERDLESLIPAQLRRFSVPGAQIYIFDAYQARALAFGSVDEMRERPVTTETRFQTAQLVRPLTALLVLREAYVARDAAGKQSLKDLWAPLDDRFDGMHFANPFYAGMDTERSVDDNRLENDSGRGPADHASESIFDSDFYSNSAASGLSVEFSDNAGSVLRADWNARTNAPVTLMSLLTHTSGLPVAAPRLEPVDATGEPTDESPLPVGQVIVLPGLLFQSSTYNYAYLGSYLEQRTGRDFADLIQTEIFRPVGMAHSCVQRADCVSADNWSGAFNGGRQMREAYQVVYPASESLYTTASDYGRWLRQLPLPSHKIHFPDSALFSMPFVQSANVDGVTPGFFRMRGMRFSAPHGKWMDSGTVYYIEGYLPGSAAYAFITEQGHGAVLINNGGDVDFNREIVQYLYSVMGVMEQPPRSPLPEEQQQALRNATTADGIDEIAGFYRPVHALPPDRSFFQFLGDVHLLVQTDDDDGAGFILESMFDKGDTVRLYPMLKADTFLARGDAPMDGWRVHILRDANEQVIGLATNRAVYRRVPAYQSAWAVILGLAMIPIAPFLVYIGITVWRNRRR